MQTTILIDPACDFYYSSFFILGLKNIYGRGVKFSSKYFHGLKYDQDTHIFSFVVQNRNLLDKIVIDFADAPDINEHFLNWCDRYGKINYRFSMVCGIEKIIPVSPNFAVKIWPKPVAGAIALLNYLKSYDRSIPFYFYLSKYLMTARRTMNFHYPDSSTKPGYIFFMSTWWEGQDRTNRLRANFIRACRSIPGIEFEGGLVPDCPDKLYPEYDDVLIKDLIPYDQYIQKTRRSIVVFNTPAYHLCHGWKLAEFLAMGKAIISTSMVNELPVPFEHLKNIYFVSDEIDKMIETIRLLSDNEELRLRLGKGAHDYYQSYVSPEKSLLSVL